MSAWSALRPRSASSRSAVGGTTTSAWSENETTPTRKPFGRSLTNELAASRAAVIRSGATSVAVIEPELSIARITVASSRATATATCGLAMPTTSAVRASSVNAAGM